MLVAIEYKPTSSRPEMLYSPKYGFSVELVETILCINATSDEGVVKC